MQTLLVLPAWAHQQAQKMCCPSAVFSTEHVSVLQDRLWAAENRSLSVAILWQHAGMRKSKGWQGFGELLWCRVCGCDIPAPPVQKVGAGHRLQARNMLMLIYGSSRRRGICLLHIQVSHLWAIIPTQVWVDAKKKIQNHFFRIAG